MQRRDRITPLPPMPAPKFATARDPQLYSVGPRQIEFAKIWLRQPLLRWQQLVVDVAGERRPDGRARYKIVLVTVQRQSGKTHMDFAAAAERCLTRPGFRAFYTAQTGKDAQASFLKLHDALVDGSPLGKITKVRRGNGHADLTFPNKSLYAPAPPTEEAGHGDQSDRFTIDEAWAHSLEQGQELMQAIGPTQLTRPDGQIWIVSAGGTAQSTWLAELVARGRAGDPEICYFEWAIPDDLPLDDDQAIAEHHPAYGELVDAHAIGELRTLFDGDPAGFARAAGNRWTEVIGGVIPADVWAAAQWCPVVPDDAPVGYGAARAADGSVVAIVVAAQVDDRIVCEVVDLVPSWQAATHVTAWADSALAVDKLGASTTLYQDLAGNKHLLNLTGNDIGGACAFFADGLVSGGVVVRPHAAMDDAVKVAGKRLVGDGGWRWAHVLSGAAIAPLEAATLAVHALRNRPRSIGKPVTRPPGEGAAA